ncbi:MAG TPA: glycosyltransferase family 2 protein [Polyangiaceae bacterium]|jgi:glycosyltransferase involved in cell wall biosynthesis
MLGSARVAVIVPAYRESRLIGRTVSTLPAFVDAIYVIDDASDDDTSATASVALDARGSVLTHAVNRGVGAAIVTGYRAALAEHADVLAVMAGDAQMAPEDLASIVEPVAARRADYVKGNRFVHADAARMPLARRGAGRVLSWATRLATGLSVDDCQCGFTALSATAARALPLDDLWPRYGYPNDLLGMLGSRGFRVEEVPVRPIYADEESGVRPWHALSVLGLIARRYLRERDVRAGEGVSIETA